MMEFMEDSPCWYGPAIAADILWMDNDLIRVRFPPQDRAARQGRGSQSSPVSVWRAGLYSALIQPRYPPSSNAAKNAG